DVITTAVEKEIITAEIPRALLSSFERILRSISLPSVLKARTISVSGMTKKELAKTMAEDVRLPFYENSGNRPASVRWLPETLLEGRQGVAAVICFSRQNLNRSAP